MSDNKASINTGARNSLSAFLAAAMKPRNEFRQELEGHMRKVDARSAPITKFLKNAGFECKFEGPVEIWVMRDDKAAVYLKVTQPTYEILERTYAFHLSEPLRDHDSERGVHLPDLRLEVDHNDYLCTLQNIGGDRNQHVVRAHSTATNVIKELQGYLCDAMPQRVMTLINAHTKIHKPEQP